MRVVTHENKGHSDDKTEGSEGHKGHVAVIKFHNFNFLDGQYGALLDMVREGELALHDLTSYIDGFIDDTTESRSSFDCRVDIDWKLCKVDNFRIIHLCFYKQ